MAGDSNKDPFNPNLPNDITGEIPYSATTPLMDDEMRGELLAAFKSELDEYLEILNRDLMKLERGSTDEGLLNEIFRTAHSMKGTSGAFGLVKIQKLAHSLENLFSAIRQRRYTPDKVAFDICYEGLDTINSLMEFELAGMTAPTQVETIFAQRIEDILKNAATGAPPSQPTGAIVVNKTDPGFEVPTQAMPQPAINMPAASPVVEPVASSTAMLADDYMRGELLAAFKSELDEYLEILNRDLIRLEQGETDPTILQGIFRTAHSMKGTSGAFGLTKIQKIAHSMENLFGAVRQQKYALDKRAFDICYEGLDLISSFMELELAGQPTNTQADLAFAQRIDALLATAVDQPTMVVSPTDVAQALAQYQPAPAPVPPPVAAPVAYTPPPAPAYVPPAPPVDNKPVQQTAMLADDYMRNELLIAFKSELDEYLEILNADLMKLERGSTDEGLLNEIFRTAHSMKGTSGAFGLTKIQKIAHSMENLFSMIRQRKYTPDKAAFDICYEGLDIINRLMELELAGVQPPEPVEITFAQNIDALLSRAATPAPPSVPVAPPPVATPIATMISPIAPLPPPPAPINKAAQPQQPPIVRPGSYNPLPVIDVDESKTAEIKVEEILPSEDLVPSPKIKTTPIERAQALEVADKKPLDTTADKPKALEAINNAAKNEFIRIPLNKIDRLMSDLGELIITRNRYERRLTEVQNIGAELSTILKDFLRLRPLRRKNTSKHKTEKDKQLDLIFSIFDTCQLKLKNTNSAIQLHAEDFANDDLHLELVTSSIQQEIQGLRMLAIGSTLFEPLRRRARDVARKQDKDVQLDFEGGETELDRQLIEAMRDPLIHIITNSIDHGLESSGDRAKMGKSITGHLKLTAGQRGNQILIEISDDGGGINIARVKQKAVSVGLYTERELELLSEQEIVSIIFQPGFSTKAAVTEISGRGVGLDVVKVAVEKLNGQIEVMSFAGKGTTFRITLPLTLSTQRTLLVKSAEQIFALPVNAIERVMSAQSEQVFTVGHRMAISLDGKPVPLTFLDEVLGIAENKTERKDFILMIINQASERVAYIIDEVLGEQEMVVKPLGKPLRKLKNIAGGAILGDGSVVLLLNPAELVRSVRSIGRTVARTLISPEEQKPQKKRILIADDSITTRTMEKNILEMAGYEVSVAFDGAQAWDLVRSQPYQLIISDIEMPNMTGIELTTSIKADNQLKHLPVILVSSLDSQTDKARGAQAGADAYIVKGQFDQKEFLEIVGSMLTA